jgi:phage-related protein
MNPIEKPVVWLHGEVKTPPFSKEARMEAGYLLRLLQGGESLGLPWSRPMPSIGSRCHELRINDLKVTWRIVYYVGADCIVILGVFEKKTQKTPQAVIGVCGRRLRKFFADSGE